MRSRKGWSNRFRARGELENAAVVGSIRCGAKGGGECPFFGATSLSAAAFLERHCTASR
jgi:hypothetical protein